MDQENKNIDEVVEDIKEEVQDSTKEIVEDVQEVKDDLQEVQADVQEEAIKKVEAIKEEINDELDIPNFRSVKSEEPIESSEENSDEDEADEVEEAEEEADEDEEGEKPKKSKGGIVILAIIALLGVVGGLGWKLLFNNSEKEEVKPTETPVVVIEETPVATEETIATATPEASIEATSESEATVSPTEEADKGGEATATPEASATPIVYQEGDGPQGSAGRIYNANGTSFAVNYSGKESKQGTTIYKNDESMMIIPDAGYSYSIGSTLSWVDEYGYAYDYQCTQVYSVHKDSVSGVYKLSDGTAIDDATYGALAIINNGQVAFFEIQ